MITRNHLEVISVDLDFKGLDAEASDCFPNAIRTETAKDDRPDAYGRFRSGRSHWLSAGGSVLASMHEGTMLKVVNSVSGGVELFPTRSAFIYYEPGDYIGPHQDVQQCEVTALVSLTDGSALQIYRNGLDGDSHTVLDRFLAGSLVGEDRIEMPKHSALIIEGGTLLHAKRPSSKRSVTAVFCFLTV